MVRSEGSNETVFDLEELEFGAVLELLAARTRTPLGRRRALELRPAGGAAEVDWRRTCLSETLKLYAAGFCFRFQELEEPGEALDRLSVEGAVLDRQELANLSRMAGNLSDLRSDLEASGAAVPKLLEVVRGVEDLSPLIQEARRIFTPAGLLEDRASAQLGAIRRRRAAAAETLRHTLLRHLDESREDGYLQDEFVTQRNDRFVIPVRSDSRHAVEGIVHGTSTTGLTLFVEPLETVGLNNELVRLGEEEKAEELRILAALTDLARRHRTGLRQAEEAVGFCDLQGAAATWGLDAGARPAETSPDGGMVLEEARHPLLDHKLRQEGRGAIPITVRMRGAERVLVLSGPNTGGKTVALMTVGLAALMNQAGLPVWARRAVLPRFGQVLADIGDHQSIEANLSTYSSHVNALVRMTSSQMSPALVLIDELGTGTDPEEGTALGIAIVEFFLHRSALVVLTTHHNGLKAFAETTSGVVNAAVEFDEETIQPTYRLIAGVAGRSGGLDIAARLGLNEEIVGKARSLISEQGQLTASYVSRLAELTAAAADDRAAARRERRSASEETRDARQERAREMARTRREVQESLAGLKDRFDQLLAESLSRLEDAAERRRLKKKADRARAEFSRRARREVDKVIDAGSEPPGPPGTLRAGDRVLLRSLGREAIVEQIGSDGRVRLTVGGARWVVEPEALARIVPRPGRAVSSHAVSVQPGGETHSSELYLVGQRVEEALAALDRFLDRALLGGPDEVRIVHGHGSGRLRSAVRKSLSGHLAVASYRAADPGGGGDGATIVRLKE